MELTSINEALPTPGEYVICYNEVGDWYLIGQLVNNQWLADDTRKTPLKVTHWSLLPKKPNN